MSIENVCQDMSEKASGIDPLGKTLLFDFDDEQMLIDGTGVRMSSPWLPVRMLNLIVSFECHLIRMANYSGTKSNPSWRSLRARLK